MGFQSGSGDAAPSNCTTLRAETPTGVVPATVPSWCQAGAMPWLDGPVLAIPATRANAVTLTATAPDDGEHD